MKSLLIREKSVSLHPLKQNNGRVAQLNRVADYGSAGYRFESCRGHREVASQMQPFFIGIRQYICTTGIVRSIEPNRDQRKNLRDSHLTHKFSTA